MTLLTLPFPTIDPVLISFGPFAIRWYALAYIAGLLLGWRYGLRLIATERLWPRQTAPMRAEHYDDFLMWAAIGIVLGGRLGYVLFYNAGYFLANPLEIFMVWDGGMAFHGGVLGLILASWLYARAHNISALSLLDIIAAVGPLGLFFGRIANFINGELYGRVSDVPWAMVFPDGGPLPRHPSQLYEAALEGIVLFVLLRLVTHHTSALQKPGMTGAIFLIGYGTARTFVEFFRMPDAHIGFLSGGLTMGMLLSIPMVVLGILIAIIIQRHHGQRHSA